MSSPAETGAAASVFVVIIATVVLVVVVSFVVAAAVDACALQHPAWVLSQHPLRQSSQPLLQPQRVPGIVYAMTSSIFTGVTGSSLAITSSHARGHLSVALYRMSTLRHEPGCSVGGERIVDQLPVLALALEARRS